VELVSSREACEREREREREMAMSEERAGE